MCIPTTHTLNKILSSDKLIQFHKNYFGVGVLCLIINYISCCLILEFKL